MTSTGEEGSTEKLQSRRIHVTVGPSRMCYGNRRDGTQSRQESRKNISAKWGLPEITELNRKRENTVQRGTCKHTAENGGKVRAPVQEGLCTSVYPYERNLKLCTRGLKVTILESSLFTLQEEELEGGQRPEAGRPLRRQKRTESECENERQRESSNARFEVTRQ